MVKASAVTALGGRLPGRSLTGSNLVFHSKLEAGRVERVQQLVCGGPAEQEGPVCPEEALPEGGSRAALALPGEHPHAGTGLQQPCLPPRMEPWALVSGKTWSHESCSFWDKDGGQNGGGVLAPHEALRPLRFPGSYTECT